MIQIISTYADILLCNVMGSKVDNDYTFSLVICLIPFPEPKSLM